MEVFEEDTVRMLGVPFQTVHISMYKRCLMYLVFVFYITKHNGTFRILEKICGTQIIGVGSVNNTTISK